MLAWFREMTSEAMEEFQRLWDEHVRVIDPQQRVENELMILYGSGEISQDRYRKLKTKLQKGQIGRGDLAIVKREAMVRAIGEGRPPLQAHSRALKRSLERLYLDRGRVEDARLEVERTIAVLEGEAGRAQEQAEDTRQKAAATLPNEQAARALLEQRQNLLEIVDRHQRRIQALRESLVRLDALRSELNMAGAGLRLLDTEERLSELESGIGESLYFNKL